MFLYGKNLYVQRTDKTRADRPKGRTSAAVFAETAAINEAAFAWLAKADDADFVLIAGDLSFNGEKKSNEKTCDPYRL